jgi:DSF synthase
LPILTVGLVQGAALGGGFEALLSFDYVVAERDATFGLPEILFGLFPGMGAHSLLSR